MRKLSTVSILICCLLFAFVSLSAEEKIDGLGYHPLFKSRDLQKEDLLKIISEKADDIKKGFTDAGYGEDMYNQFVKQLEAGNIGDAIEVNPGEKIEWMIFRPKKDEIEVKKDLVWSAEKPFLAFTIVFSKKVKEDVQKEYRKTITTTTYEKYNFIVPKTCGNISLKGLSTYTDTKETPISNLPPTCDLKVTPDEILAGKSITLDASGSKDNDPEICTESKIASVKFVIAVDGNVVEEKTLTEKPFIYTTKIKKHGICKVSATVTDNEGATASGACEKEIVVLQKNFLLADIGFLYQWDPAWFIPIRIGFMHKFSKSIGVIGMVGVAPVVSGDDDTTAILADMTLTYWPNKFFFGIGAGYFGSKMNKRVDFILNTGFQVIPHVSLFLEGRCAFDEFDVIDKFGRLGLGFRIRY